MMTSEATGKVHTNFISWARDNDIYVNGVEPAELQGQGIGIVASRDIKVGLKLS